MESAAWKAVRTILEMMSAFDLNVLLPRCLPKDLVMDVKSMTQKCNVRS